MRVPISTADVSTTYLGCGVRQVRPHKVVRLWCSRYMHDVAISERRDSWPLAAMAQQGPSHSAKWWVQVLYKKRMRQTAGAVQRSLHNTLSCVYPSAGSGIILFVKHHKRTPGTLHQLRVALVGVWCG